MKMSPGLSVLKFEVASVKRNLPGSRRALNSLKPIARRLTATNVTLGLLILI